MFDLQPLPDMILHAQFKLLSTPAPPGSPDGTGATPLPAYARRYGIIDLSYLRYSERSDLYARFQFIGSVDMSYFAGLRLHHVAVYERTEADPRSDICLRLHVELENITNHPITITPANTPVITLAGMAASPVGHDYARQPPRLLVAPPGRELVVKTLDNITLAAQWIDMASGMVNPAPVPTEITLEEQLLLLTENDTNYLVGADFSAVGTFSSVCYQAILLSDTPELIITQQCNNTAPGKAFWTIRVPADVAIPSYQPPPDQSLCDPEDDECLDDPPSPDPFPALAVMVTAHLAGSDWSGGVTEDVAATWDDLVAIE